VIPVKCLLVDDRDENLIALEALLANEGLECLRARSGAEALNLLLDHDCALALVDVHMPEMDGFELAELMRGAERTRNIPIIFVTAGPEDRTRVFQGYEAGAVDFLFKPLSEHVVKSKVRVFVELYHQRTLLKEQVELLRRSEEATRQAVEARNRFISIAGHELRTPLTVLRLQLDMARRALLREGASLDPAGYARLLERLRGQVDRLVPLVDEMLDVARIQSGRLQIRQESFDLGAMARDVADRFQPLLQDAGCSVALDCAEGVVGEWDRFRLEQVVSNLLSNAVRYGGGGVVTIRVRRDGKRAELTISDQGPGIAPADLKRIFEPFERGEVGADLAGLGLGLHIVQQIVHMHGGSVRVGGEPGKGAQFTVSLPLVAAGADSPAHAPTL